MGLPNNLSCVPVLAGKGDQTVCFHCGGGVRDWEETDDPWVEHGALFPKCTHVVLTKGQIFIEECKLKKSEATFKVGLCIYFDLEWPTEIRNEALKLLHLQEVNYKKTTTYAEVIKLMTVD